MENRCEGEEAGTTSEIILRVFQEYKLKQQTLLTSFKCLYLNWILWSLSFRCLLCHESTIKKQSQKLEQMCQTAIMSVRLLLHLAAVQLGLNWLLQHVHQAGSWYCHTNRLQNGEFIPSFVSNCNFCLFWYRTRTL